MLHLCKRDIFTVSCSHLYSVYGYNVLKCYRSIVMSTLHMFTRLSANKYCGKVYLFRKLF